MTRGLNSTKISCESPLKAFMEAKTPPYVGFILAIRALSTGLQDRWRLYRPTYVVCLRFLGYFSRSAVWAATEELQ